MTEPTYISISHWGLFPLPPITRREFVSLSETVARTQPDERGMINPYKKPRPVLPRHFDEEV
jgi:hypothetical protein